MSWSDRPKHRNLTYSQGAPLGPAVETTEIKDGSVVFWRGLRDTRWMTGFMERLDRPGQQASLGGTLIDPCGAGGDPWEGGWWTDAPDGGGGCFLNPN